VSTNDTLSFSIAACLQVLAALVMLHGTGRPIGCSVLDRKELDRKELGHFQISLEKTKSYRRAGVNTSDDLSRCYTDPFAWDRRLRGIASSSNPSSPWSRRAPACAAGAASQMLVIQAGNPLNASHGAEGMQAAGEGPGIDAADDGAPERACPHAAHRRHTATAVLPPSGRLPPVRSEIRKNHHSNRPREKNVARHLRSPGSWVRRGWSETRLVSDGAQTS
jgi:hypothetical protein